MPHVNTQPLISRLLSDPMNNTVADAPHYDVPGLMVMQPFGERSALHPVLKYHNKSCGEVFISCG